MELNREQIINSLECCTKPECGDCPYDGDELLRPCHHNMMLDALALIRELTEENERLRVVADYTGLTDKNGKKIFEGDIGRYKQTDGAKRNGKPIICTGKVVYWAKTASYAVESKDEAGCKYFDYFPIKDFEVIGNIHDNPELLEGGDGS